jgi:hypothetical protein
VCLVNRDGSSLTLLAGGLLSTSSERRSPQPSGEKL